MKLTNIFNSQTKTFSGAAGILLFSALSSRILGVLRDWLLARSFGAGKELDVYFTAFKIPDLVFNVLITGGIVVAFLPLFSEYFIRDEKDAWQFTNNVLNVFLLFLIVLCFFLLIFTPEIIKLIAPGFDAQQRTQASFLTRLMFLSPILLGLSSVFSGVLQYFNRFLIYGLCPILYNLGIIFGILFLSNSFGILGAVIGVILGSLLHFAIQLPSAFSCGFRYKPLFNLKGPGIKRIFLLMTPRTFGIAAQQFNLIFINAIASALPVGSIAVFNFANNLQSFPIGIIGVSFAISAFPALSRSWAEKRKEKFIADFSLFFRHILYFTIPISFLLFILREQIVELVYRHGQFSLASSHLTAACLGLFSLTIFSASLIPLIFRAFFSFQDTKTPTLIAVLSVGFNIFLALFFTRFLSVPGQFQNFFRTLFPLQNIEDISVLGLALAVSAATLFQFVLMLFFLQKRLGDLGTAGILNSFFKMVFAAFLAALTANFVLNLVSGLGTFGQILISGFAGTLLYFLLTLLLKSPEIKNFRFLTINKKKSSLE